MKWRKSIYFGFFWHTPFAPTPSYKYRHKHPKKRQKNLKNTISKPEHKRIIKLRTSPPSKANTKNPDVILDPQKPIVHLHRDRIRELCTSFVPPNRCIIFKLCRFIETCHSYQQKSSPKGSVALSKESLAPNTHNSEEQSPRYKTNIRQHRRQLTRNTIIEQSSITSKLFICTQTERTVLRLYSRKFASIKFVSTLPGDTSKIKTTFNSSPSIFIKIDNTYITKLSVLNWYILKQENSSFLCEKQFTSIVNLLEYLLSQKNAQRFPKQNVPSNIPTVPNTKTHSPNIPSQGTNNACVSYVNTTNPPSHCPKARSDTTSNYIFATSSRTNNQSPFQNSSNRELCYITQYLGSSSQIETIQPLPEHISFLLKNMGNTYCYLINKNIYLAKIQTSEWVTIQYIDKKHYSFMLHKSIDKALKYILNKYYTNKTSS